VSLARNVWDALVQEAAAQGVPVPMLVEKNE
jgi:hypothetical protein